MMRIGSKRVVRQLAWFVALWVAGVAAVVGVAFAIRSVLGL